MKKNLKRKRKPAEHFVRAENGGDDKKNLSFLSRFPAAIMSKLEDAILIIILNFLMAVLVFFLLLFFFFKFSFEESSPS